MKANTTLIALTALALSACGKPGQSGTVSNCGGFAGQGTQALTTQDAPDYCDAEVLVWTYDSAAKSLNLSNERVPLNCCGEHSVTLAQKDETTFTMSEVDQPEFGDARCGCMCVFDFRVEGNDIDEGVITLELSREVTDSETPLVEVFSGQIDLSEGSGRLVIDAEPVMMGCGDSTL